MLRSVNATQTVNAYDYRHKLLRTVIGRNAIIDIYVYMCVTAWIFMNYLNLLGDSRATWQVFSCSEILLF